MKVVFFAPVRSRDILDRVQFYAQDIKILRELGHEVVTATRSQEVPWDCDFYFVWWWTWAFVPLAKAKMMRKPSLITGTFDYRIPYPGITDYFKRPWYKKALIRLALRATDANVFVSKPEYEAIREDLPVTNPQYVPHGVEVDRYKPGEEDEARKPFVLTVAWSGRENGRRKCLAEIIRSVPLVVQNHPHVRFVMAGEEGEFHPELVRLVNALGVSNSVEFLGVISEEHKIKLMQECAVYLQPSKYEGFGVAIAEAMSCGAAVVSSPVGAVPEVVGDTGLLVNGLDIPAIADAVSRLLDDPELRRNLGRRSRERIVSLFSYNYRKHKIAAIIDTIMAR